MDLPKTFRAAGIIILAAGLIAAVIIYRNAKPEEKLGIVGLDIPSKHDLLQTERQSGKAGLAANDFLAWYGSLWHGRQLGDTLLFLSLATCAGCFYLAHLKTDLPRDDEQQDKKSN